MPTIGIFKDELEQRLEQPYTEDQFADLCFDFGIELDDVTTEAELAAKLTATGESAGQSDADSSRIVYRIDIPANRYDLLCIEGLARGLRIFLGKEKTPVCIPCGIWCMLGLNSYSCRCSR
jgi:phenylalanyl-tRNA synthetase beta chain